MEPNENAILATVERFARDEIAARLPGGEASLDDAALARIIEGARAVGVLASDGAGAGLWEGDDPGERLHISLAMLDRLASANTGVAFQLHALALGRWLVCRAGLEGAGAALVPVFAGITAREGSAGFPGAFVNATGPTSELILQAGVEWDALIIPTVEGAGEKASIGWGLVTRASANAQPTENAHGLDETRLFRIRPSRIDRRSSLAPDEARALLVEALGLHQLALVALGLGALRRGLSIARAYAHDRIQGGQRLEEHEAVQLMLGEADAAVSATELALGGVPAPPTSPAALASVLGLRSVLQPELSRAASLCLQALGGIGYMRDAGLEKVFRDCNHLRVIAGAPDELRLAVAELRRAMS